MNQKLGYFIAAAILAAYMLVLNGVPPLAVAAGIAGAALYMRRKSRAA